MSLFFWFFYITEVLEENKNLFAEKIFNDRLRADKELYRVRVSKKSKFSWKISYKYSDLFISSSEDVSAIITGRLSEFYNIIEKEIKKNPAFEKSLSPFPYASDSNWIISEMNDAAKAFNVGPMAAVAGALCEFIARDIKDDVRYLIIENGGDAYIRSKKDIITSVFFKSLYFKDDLKIKISKTLLPCGIASSSGVFGHSTSLGKSDIALVIAKDAITADAAATAFANLIKKPEDLEDAVNLMKINKEILGLLAVKDEKIAVYGQVELI